MGGYRGGRDARNLLAESGLRLRISDLVNGEPIYAGTCRRGSVAWTNSYTRKPSGAVAFRIEAWEETGNMRLRLALVDRATGEPVIREQVIGLTATVQPCGGWRWWFICLRRHDLCSVLHCPPGALAFVLPGLAYVLLVATRRPARARPTESAAHPYIARRVGQYARCVPRQTEVDALADL